jgi:tetratricopeptide (TPR) repeat protein
MKTARRQELRTNELSVQIDQISETVKKNYTSIIAIAVAAAVIVGGLYWYVTSSRNRLMDGWAALSVREEKSDADHDISRMEEVINQNLDPKLTAAAWLKVGQTSMAQYTWPSAGADAGSTGDPKWLEKSQNAYTSALATNVLDKNGVADATIHLGLIAENKGDFDKAAEQYRKVINDTAYAGTPFFEQAEFRLKNIDKWRSAVVFAPPPPKLTPTTASAPSPDMPTVIDMQTGIPTSQPDISPEQMKTILEAIKNAPAEGQPTTQPANP